MPPKNGTSRSNKMTQSCQLVSNLKVSDEYVLQSSVNNKLNESKLAVSLASKEILVFDLSSKMKTHSFTEHTESVTGLKFLKENPHILLSSSLDGRILTWDLRSKTSPVQTFTDETDDVKKPLTCFDANSSEDYICGGTEAIREDAFLIFWDRRTSQNLGGYWNSHTNEITQVRFHASAHASLASSSVDGLVNVFDLSQASEEEALANTLNTDSSVVRFCWCHVGGADVVACVTGTEEFQFWSCEAVKPSITRTRHDLSQDFSQNVDYLIDTVPFQNVPCLLAGTNSGCVRLYSCSEADVELECSLENGHSDVVRTVSTSPCSENIITGGEDGRICVWKASL